METITVSNSSKRSWLIVVLGGLLMVVASDLLVWNGFVADLAQLVYQGEEVLEARERVWGAMIAATGAVLVVWGVAPAIRGRPALTVGPQGLRIALRGPFRPLDSLPWEGIERVFPQPVADAGTLLASLTIVLRDTELSSNLPIDPWGARWGGERVLRVLASDWSDRPEAVAALSTHYLDLATQSAPAAADLE